MMPGWVIYLIGFTAQLLFSARLILQWLASEKSKRVVTPGSFWIHSLVASFLLFVYGYLRNDFAIMLGQTITYFIYIRNFQIKGDWQKILLPLRIFILLFPFIVIVYYFNNNRMDMHLLLRPQNIEPWLLYLGIAGQVVFTFRFIVQWLYAEKTRQSVLPPAFWYWSVCGSALIITYAIFRQDPVLLTGQIVGFFVYLRNIIMLIRHAD